MDEADLTALMEDGQTEAPVCSCTDKCVAGSVNTACPVCSVNMSECAGVEAEPEPEETEQPPEEEKAAAWVFCLSCCLLPQRAAARSTTLRFEAQKDAAKGSSSLDDLDFDEDDEETEVVETEQTEQEDDNL